jgi:catechol 2,3-dioxygenase-like lactoylglutathione lyase family enzyme
MAIWPETTFSHITLDVADVEACAHFWEEHCTLRRVHRARGENNEDVIWLQEPGRERELAVALASAPDGYTRSTRTPLGPRSLAGHFGFSTKTMKDVDEGAAKAKKHGVLRRPAVNTPHPVGYLCEMEDPSGNVIELAYGQPPQSFNWPSFKREAEKHAMLAREHAERGDFGGAYRHGVYSAGLYPFDLDFVRSVKSWRSKAHAQTTELTELAFASAREENYSLAHRLGTDSLRVYPFDVLLQRAVREWQVKAGLGPAPSAVELEG